MEVQELDCKLKVPRIVLRAYLISLFFLVVLLFLAVGDALHEPAENLMLSLSDAFISHYNLESSFFT